MIIITGGTGHLGHLIVERLVERVPAGSVGVSVRDPAKADKLTALGVRVRQGDFEQPENLWHAFEGATQVLIVSSNARASGGDPLAQHRAAIATARTVGARRIVYTSHMAASASSSFPPMLDHHATEEMLARCGIPWTALRHGFYTASGIALMGDAFNTGLLEAPADGRVSWTAHADLAEAAAILSVDEGRFEGPTPPLTGSEALDLEGLANIASQLLDRRVDRLVISDEYLKSRMSARGISPHAAAIAFGLYLASRRGEFAIIDPTLELLLGRKPITVRALIAENVGRDRGTPNIGAFTDRPPPGGPV